MRLTPEELENSIRRGRQMREVLNAEAFLGTVNDLSDFFMSQIAACMPTDEHLPALRHAHLMHVALGEIVAHMGSVAAAGEEAERILADLISEQEDTHDD